MKSLGETQITNDFLHLDRSYLRLATMFLEDNIGGPEDKKHKLTFSRLPILNISNLNRFF